MIAKRTSLKGRVVAWLEEVFGDGKAENRNVIQAFCDAVRSEYGNRAGDEVTQQLRARLEEGKPLRVRRVQRVIGKVQAAKQALATRLADLGDDRRGTDARTRIKDLFKAGALSHKGVAALLGLDSEDRARLEADIKQAVLEAAPRDGDQPLGLAPAILATKRAVDEAASRLKTAENEALAARLADLGDGTPARARIQDLVKQRVLSPEVADAFLMDLGSDAVQGLKAKIQNAILQAGQGGKVLVSDDQAADIARAQVDAYLQRKLAVLGDLGRVTGLSEQEASALRNMVLTQDRWGSEDSGVARLVNNHRFVTDVKPAVDGMIDWALEKCALGVRRDELKPSLDKLIKNLETIVREHEKPLTRDGAMKLAENTIYQFAEAKGGRAAADRQ